MNSVLNDWETRKLKFVATCNDDALSETTDPEFEMEYVDISSVNLVEGVAATETVTFDKAPSRARRIVQDGDTIISTVRTYLKAIASIQSPPANMVVSTGFAVIRPTDAIDGGFLGYALQNTAFIELVVANSTGVSYPAINPSLLTSLPIAFPRSLATQKQIAAFLDWKTSQIDALIAKKQTLLQKLKEKRLAVITQAVTKGLNPDAPLRDSGIAWLGEVPTHWEVKRLKWAIMLQRGHDLPADERGQGDVPLVSSAGISAFHDVAIARAPGIVTGRYGTIGVFHLIEEDYWPLNTTLYSIDMFGNDPKFLRALLESLSPLFLLNSKKSAVPGVDRNDVHLIEVALPSLEEQNQIAAYISTAEVRHEQVTKNAESAITRLTEYRSALITAATTGKIDVRGWQNPAM